MASADVSLSTAGLAAINFPPREHGSSRRTRTATVEMPHPVQLGYARHTGGRLAACSGAWQILWRLAEGGSARQRVRARLEEQACEAW